MIDLTGKQFGRLTVRGGCEVRPDPRRRYWCCECQCGQARVVRQTHLLSGATQSCGCFNQDRAIERQWRHGQCRPATAEYRAWKAMRGRCLNPWNRKYQHYGGRGIGICAQWSDFQSFYEDMGPRPSPSHSLDRIDNDGHYEPRNCRWATATQQANNRQFNHLITHDGLTQTLAQWARTLGVSPFTLSTRIERGASIELVVRTPVPWQRLPLYEWQGQTRSLTEWARVLNISVSTLRNRLSDGWSIARTLSEPLHQEKSSRQRTHKPLTP